jgi:hypothetical protein
MLHSAQFWIGFLAGGFVGGTLGAVTMAACAAAANADRRDDAATRWPPNNKDRFENFGDAVGPHYDATLVPDERFYREKGRG